jgi:hypothetical protein
MYGVSKVASIYLCMVGDSLFQNGGGSTGAVGGIKTPMPLQSEFVEGVLRANFDK